MMSALPASRNGEAPKAATFRASISKTQRENIDMKSITTAATTINVPFYGANLFVVEINGEPYTPMKSIIDGMGMDWASQFTKLKSRFKTCVVKITMQLPGDDQKRDVICLGCVPQLHIRRKNSRIQPS